MNSVSDANAFMGSVLVIAVCRRDRPMAPLAEDARLGWGSAKL